VDRTTCGNWPPAWREGIFSRSTGILFANLDGDTAEPLWSESLLREGVSLLHEIESKAPRDFGLVRAIKEYTYMDQAAVQNVEHRKSLETTLKRS